MKSKQTAVEWLEQEFIALEKTTGVFGVMYEIIEQAKTMEKEQQEKLVDDALTNYVLKHKISDYVSSEITDIEISKQAQKHGVEEHSFFTEATQNQKRLSFFAGAKWYREQLKARQ